MFIAYSSRAVANHESGIEIDLLSRGCFCMNLSHRKERGDFEEDNRFNVVSNDCQINKPVSLSCCRTYVAGCSDRLHYQSSYVSDIFPESHACSLSYVLMRQHNPQEKFVHNPVLILPGCVRENIFLTKPTMMGMSRNPASVYVQFCFIYI